MLFIFLNTLQQQTLNVFDPAETIIYTLYKSKSKSIGMGSSKFLTKNVTYMKPKFLYLSIELTPIVCFLKGD